MNQFDFYKKREISSYLSDTFLFFRIYVKNFFKNYMFITGPVILGFVIISAFILGGGSIASIVDLIKNGDFSSFISYFLSSIILIVALGILAMIFISTFGFSYAKICEKYPDRNNFTASELLSDMKSIFGRTLLFYILSLFVVVVPLSIAYGILFFIIKFIPSLSGILTFVLQTGLGLIISIWLGQTSLLYIKDKEGFFDSISKGLEVLKVGFWHKIGATWVMSIIVQVLSIIVIIVPIVITVVQIYSGISTNNIVILSIIWVVVLVTLFMIYNLSFFLQMIIHYSTKSDKKTYSDIDQIGQNTEE